jgi:hypothetical protein
MSSHILSVQELKSRLSEVDFMTANSFSIMQSLCAHFNNIEDEEFQELILRALEHRDLFGESRKILYSLVREVGLFPFLEPDELGLSDRIAYEYHRPINMDNPSIVFHRPQARVYREIMNGRSVILSAPTSFGKSLIIDAIVASMKFDNILIIVPTIALIDETRRRINSLKSIYKVITHASQSLTKNNIFVFTQERAIDYEEIEKIVDFFVIDEFYKLSPDRDDENRTILLNQIFYRLTKSKKQFYLLGPNITDITTEFKSRIDFVFLYEPYNTVVSEVHFVEHKKSEALIALVNLCRSIVGQTIIFCKSPKQANKIANLLIENSLGRDYSDLADVVEWIGREYHPDWNFVRSLEEGIGIHHGRIPRALAQYIIRAFNAEKIKFLICTSTLIEGVNTNAKNIIIFDDKISNKKFDCFTFNNIKGRSGRMFKHFIGHVYLFHDPPQQKLPLVDIPAYTQPTNTSESLLIQIEDEDLRPASREKLRRYKEQNILSFLTLKQNVGVEPYAQIKLAEVICSNISTYHQALNWHRYPTYEQLEIVCDLIWKYFNGSRLGGDSVRSSRQLAYKINQLRSKSSIAAQIQGQIDSHSVDPDDSVQNVLDFNRLWAGFHFPRLLRVVNAIQRDVFTSRELRPGNYDFFANQVENYFLDPALVALDEYGIPIQLACVLEEVLKPEGNLDIALQRLKGLTIERLSLSPFERELLLDAQESISL